MKVDLCIPALDVGGSERQLVGLAIALAARGVDVCIVALRGGGPLTERVRSAGIQLVELDALNGESYRSSSARRILRAPVLTTRLARHLGNRRPDALEAWLPEAQIIALPVARAVGVPHRVMAMRSLALAAALDPASQSALRMAARSSTIAVGNCRAVIGDPGWPIQGLRTAVIPNAVDLPAEPADPGVQPPRGIMVANLLPYKGHRYLLEALARLSEPPLVDLVGSGPLADSIRTSVDARGLHKVVRLHEGVTDVGPFLQRAQFLVHTSTTEGLPNAVLEGMAYGLPVIAFDVGGVPDLVDEGVTGRLIPVGDAGALAKSLGEVLVDSCWRNVAGHEARRRSQAMTWQLVAEAHLSVLARQ